MARHATAHKRGLPLIAAGLLLVLAAVGLTGYNLWDNARAQASADEALAGVLAATPLADALLPDALHSMPVVPVDGRDYVGVLSVPALDLELPVLSEWSYGGLAVAPCRYAGSAYTDDMVVAAHNYASHFGGIGNLEPGDAVTFCDLDGNVFRYKVAVVDMLAADAVSDMVAADGWDLTLFTCTLDGASRVTVRCVSA